MSGKPKFDEENSKPPREVARGDSDYSSEGSGSDTENFQTKVANMESDRDDKYLANDKLRCPLIGASAPQNILCDTDDCVTITLDAPDNASGGPSNAVKKIATDASNCNGGIKKDTVKTDSNLKNDKKIDNDDIQFIAPQLQDLSLNSPRGLSSKRVQLNPEQDFDQQIRTFPAVRCVRLYVEMALKRTSANCGEILSVSCESIKESYRTPDLSLNTGTEQQSSSSTNFGDVSKTTSPISCCPMSYIPPPPGVINRISMASEGSGTSSTGSSSGSIMLKRLIARGAGVPLSEERIRDLKNRWENSNLLYQILDSFDKLIPETPAEKNSKGSSNATGTFLTTFQMTSQASSSLLSCDSLTPFNPTKKRAETIRSKYEPVKKRIRTSPETTPSSPLALSYVRLSGDGTFVFAKWQDRKYYAGQMIMKANDRCFVEFLDGSTRQVTEEQVILNAMDLLVGQKVMATNCDNGKYYPGIVTQCNNDEASFMYTVVTDKGDFIIPANNIYLTEHQAKQIRKAYNLDVNCSNMSVSPIRSTRSSNHLRTDSPCTSGVQRPKKLYKYSETDDDTSGSPVSEKRPSSVVTGCDLEMHFQQNLNPNIKLKNVIGKVPKSTNKIDDSIVGPLSNTGNWFKGLNFLLTCGSRNVLHNNNEEVATDCEDYPFTTIPYVQDRLEMQIRGGGGVIYRSFDEIPKNQYHYTYLVSWRPCLTTRYVHCLAMGIKLICHEWVVNCCIKQKRLPLQELPAGWSIEQSCFINMFERKTDKPFNGIRIKIAQLADKQFYKFWSKICISAGATTSKFMGNSDQTDVIVVESGFRDPKLDSSADKGVALVSATWVIQSLIHGEPRDYQKHPSYNYLYDEFEDV